MICITFDTDHLSPKQVSKFMDKYSIPGEATFFLWQPYHELNFGKHEVAPHPLVENLLSFPYDFQEFTKKLNIQFSGVRTHSCVYSHMVGIQLKELGVKYVSMNTLLHETTIKPYRHPWGIWEMPIYYMDNMDLCMKKNWQGNNHLPFSDKIIENAILHPDYLFVFDFHPLHIMLNTLSHDHYCNVKSKVINENYDPFELKMAGVGVESFFIKLLNRMKDLDLKSTSLDKALKYFIQHDSLLVEPQVS